VNVNPSGYALGWGGRGGGKGKLR